MISNVPDAQGIQRAAALDFQTAVFPSKGRPRAEHDADLIACLLKHDVDLVCLAGYMRLLSPQFITAFPNRVLNIHPSLLPAFPGLDAQKQAFDYGVKWTGCTVHFVDETWITGQYLCSALYQFSRTTTRIRSPNGSWRKSISPTPNPSRVWSAENGKFADGAM